MQIFNLFLKTEAIFKGNFPLDYPLCKEYFFHSCYPPVAK